MKILTHGFEITYDKSIQGNIPLLLIHGFPLDRTLWAEQIRGLDAHVIAPDLRGFGESAFGESATPSDAVTIDTYADDLHALLDTLNLQNVVVAGLSMGGYIALAVYRKYPQTVRGLILANTKAGADSAEGKKGRDDNAALAREKGAAAVGEKMMPKMLTPKTATERPWLSAAVSAMMARQSVNGVVAALMAMRDRPDSTPMLAQISVPTLIITGAEDTLIPPKESEAMREGIRGSKLVVIPNVAHLSNVEQPDAFNRAVNDFLKSL
ncbi:MAG: alpha/beta fold hydrolase [Chloroflexi bacterium]|nr:alpha/beta fold hydrolase [Chloroflexota bacterium]